MEETKNLPINPERRDPYKFKIKGDAGLSKTPNMSYTELQNAILSNVVSQVNEGTVYNFPKRKDGVNLITNIVKLKPNTSCTTMLFALGTWNGISEFIGFDTARLDLILSGDGSTVNYRLSVSNNSLGHSKVIVDGDDNNKGLGDVDTYQGHRYVTWNKNGVYVDRIEEGTDTSNKKYRGRTKIVGRGWYPNGDPADKTNTNRKKHDTSDTVLSSVKVVLKEFVGGGWLVSLDIPGTGLPKKVDALWVNLLGSRNIDPQLPTENQYSDSDFIRENTIEILCDKSRESSNILFENDIEGLITYSRSLNHDIKLHMECVDPEDPYNKSIKNSAGGNNSWSNSDPTSGTDFNTEIIPSINIKTNEIDCASAQNIPLTINRLNHPVKFRLSGPSLHKGQEITWKGAWDGAYGNVSGDKDEYQLNLKTTIDTARGVENEYPISISGLTHDIDLSIGLGEYQGSIPESNSEENYNGQSFKDPVDKIYSGDNQAAIFDVENGKVNYATIDSISSAYDNHFEFNDNTHDWELKNNPNGWKQKDRTLSLNTRLENNDTSLPNNKLNLVVHGVDHDMLIEVVNSDYRLTRGAATKKDVDENEDFDFEPDKKYGSGVYDPTITSGIKNLTWNSGSEKEERRYSYSTGHIRLNTFEKRNYQVLDITNHGLDHNISFRLFRDRVSDPLNNPRTALDNDASNKFRPKSGGQDLLGDVILDTFTGRVQRCKLSVIDGRYSDSTRGLAITNVSDTGEVNFIPHSDVDNTGSYGSKPSDESLPFNELIKYYPTINGVPFTGDFRHKVAYTDMAGSHSIGNSTSDLKNGVVRNSNLRNIDIFAFHAGGSLEQAGNHSWEALNTLRKAESKISDGSYQPSSSVKTREQVSALDSEKEIQEKNAYGIVRLNKFEDKTLTFDPDTEEGKRSRSNIFNFLNSMGHGNGSDGGNDDDVVTVRSLKRIIGALIGGTDEFGSIENAGTVNQEFGLLSAGSKVPIGTIVPWYNKEWYDNFAADRNNDTLPEYLTKDGWVLCNGRTHIIDDVSYETPNLMGRYIRGWDNDGSIRSGGDTYVGPGHYSDIASGNDKELTFSITDRYNPMHTHNIEEKSIKTQEASAPHSHIIPTVTRSCKVDGGLDSGCGPAMGWIGYTTTKASATGSSSGSSNLPSAAIGYPTLNGAYNNGHKECANVYTSVSDSEVFAFREYNKRSNPTGGYYVNNWNPREGVSFDGLGTINRNSILTDNSAVGDYGSNVGRTVWMKYQDHRCNTNHTHKIDLGTLKTQPAGEGRPFVLEPYYYKLVYIMKVK